MKIVFFGLEKVDQTPFTSINNAEVLFFDDKLNENNIDLIKDVDIICVFVDSMVNKQMIDALPNLKFIATRSTGFDHIDCEYARSKGILVSNVPGYGSHTVAEFAFGLLLDLSRKIISANNYVRESSDFNYFSNMEGFDLAGKTLGIIGTGKIGKNVVKIAKGFGMNVIAYDLFPDTIFAQENTFSYKTFDEVISEADILTLHAPYTKENHHLINKEIIGKMKKGVYLINTARGELVDTNALLFGLKEKIIAGAGLDVLEGERELKEEIEIINSPEKSDRFDDYKILVEDHELMKMPNVIITPHIAFYTKEAVAEILKISLENIQKFLTGSPSNLVK